MRTAGRGFLFALVLALSACGPVHGQLTMGDKNANVTVSLAEKRTLEKIEAGVAATLPPGQNCVSSRSPYYYDVEWVIAKVNPVLEKRTDILPPVRGAYLLDNPPRVEDRIGVYLCSGMEANAFTLYRSVYLSNDFIGRLKDAAPARGGTDAYTSALAFVLYHEMGHAALNHSAVKIRAGAPQFDLPQELQADQFAYDAMAAAGIGLKGTELARDAGI